MTSNSVLIVDQIAVLFISAYAFCNILYDAVQYGVKNILF